MDIAKKWVEYSFKELSANSNVIANAQGKQILKLTQLQKIK